MDWDAFSPKAVTVDSDLLTPVGEVLAVLQRYRADVDEARAEVERARRKGLEALADEAVLVVEMEKVLARYEPDMADAPLRRAHRHLRILKDQMLDRLKAEGLDVVRLRGLPYEGVAEIAEIDGWLHRAELDAEVVIDELEPAVLLRPGRVVMGAPLDAAPPPENQEHVDSDEPERAEGDEECPKSS